MSSREFDKIKIRHQRGAWISKSDIVTVNDDTAYITSQSDSSVRYTVTRMSDMCSCWVFCRKCDSACIHQYSCTCIDYSKYNLCKHIHAFIQASKSEETESDDSSTNMSSSTAEEYEEANWRIRNIEERHERGMKIPRKDIVLIKNDMAVVTSQTNPSECYTVTRILNECHCKQRCVQCDSLCAHLYSCTCKDYSQSNFLCKHIHATVMCRMSKEVVNDVPNSNTLSDVAVEEYEVTSNELSEVQSQSIENSKSRNIKLLIKSRIFQLLRDVENVENGEGDEFNKKILHHLNEATKLMEMKEKKVTVQMKSESSPNNSFESTKRKRSDEDSVYDFNYSHEVEIETVFLNSCESTSVDCIM